MVSRSSIGDDVFQVRVILREDRLDRFLDESPLIKRRGYNSNAWQICDHERQRLETRPNQVQQNESDTRPIDNYHTGL